MATSRGFDPRLTRRGFPIGLTLVTLIAFAALVGLGVWQIKRLHWKEHLLAQIAAVQSAPVQPLDQVLAQGKTAADLDFHRVRADCPTTETGPFLRLWAVKEGGAPGYRIITACTLSGGPYGSILVDRGFIAQGDVDKLQPGAGRPLILPIEGILRRGDPKNFVTPSNQPTQNLWYWRDVPAMASALGASNPAPTYLMLETPVPPPPEPTPSPVPTSIPNNHLQYAMTWFGLAAALVGVYLAMLLRRRSS